MRGMLGTQLAMRDIADVEGFVIDTLNRAPVKLAPDEFEELKAEGFLILTQLERAYDEHRDGYAQPGKFSGYAARYLPRRLSDAWHRMHREHTFATTESGKREWRYGDAPVSLEMGARVDDAGVPEVQVDPRNRLAVAAEPDPADALAVGAATSPPALPSHAHLALRPVVAPEAPTDAPERRLEANVRRALALSLDYEVELCVQVALRSAAGYKQDEIRDQFDLTPDDLKAVYGRLKRCAHLLDGVARPDQEAA